MCSVKYFTRPTRQAPGDLLWPSAAGSAGSRRAARRAATTLGADPLALARALEASGRFRRDTGLGGIFHRGKLSYRELCDKDSLHVLIDGRRVSAHVDRVSPLSCRPDGSARYSLGRVLVHNLTGMAADLARLARWRPGRQRCNLDCEVVWVDDDSAVALVDEPGEETTAAPAVPNDQGQPEPTPPEPARRPFSVVDEAVHLLDTETTPWSIQMEVRVAGHLDEARLRAALARALDAHPMARARKAPSRPSRHRDHWEIRAGVDLDPLRVVHCPDDAALSAARAELQSLAVPLAESPPLRVRLARHPDGDVVMLNVNHAAMDGFGALRLLYSLARAYAGDPDPAPQPAPDEADELLARLGRADLPTRVRRHLALAEKLRDLVAPPARLAPVGASDDAGYGFHHVRLSAARTEALAGLPHAGTVNDVLLGALNLAIAGWNAEHGRPCGRIGVLVPANLRPPQWRQDVVGNFSLPARVSTRPGSRRNPQAALRALTAQTGRKKRTGMGTALIEVLARSPRLPLWAKQAMVMALPLTGNRLVDTAMLSNMGRLEAPSFGPDAGSTVEMWFSPPARMPLGLTVGAVTVAGRLHLTFRYHRQLFSAEAARRFADRFLAELDALVDGAGTEELAS